MSMENHRSTWKNKEQYLRSKDKAENDMMYQAVKYK